MADRGMFADGTVVDGRYRILSRVAQGGMATVYVARDVRLDRDVALKALHHHLSEDPSYVARFLQEARAAASLDHPNVVQLLDQGKDPHMYLVMEYVHGFTLRDSLYQEGHLTPRLTLLVLENVLAGLAVAHAAGLIHRDVKPENVLIGLDGRIKLADFGLARHVDTHTATGSLLGTVAYIAPELVSRGRADARSDVYAVGIMAYEMLTGRQPFRGEAAIQVAYAHVNQKVPPPSSWAPGLAQELDSLVMWCTDPDPDRRPPNAQEALDEVRRLLEILPDDELDLDFASDAVTVSPVGQSVTLQVPRPEKSAVIPADDAADEEPTTALPSFMARPGTPSAGSAPHPPLGRPRVEAIRIPPSTPQVPAGPPARTPSPAPTRNSAPPQPARTRGSGPVRLRRGNRMVRVLVSWSLFLVGCAGGIQAGTELGHHYRDPVRSLLGWSPETAPPEVGPAP